MKKLEKKDTNEYCKIIEKGGLETNRAFLALWSWVHRSYYSWWKLVDIINKEYNANFIQVDWPKLDFTPDKVINQLIDYIDNSWYDEIIIWWLSFWEVVSNALIEALEIQHREDLLKRIKLQLSISWVSSMENTIWVKLPFIKTKVWNKLYKLLTWCAGKIDRHNPIKKLRWAIGKNWVDYWADITPLKKKLHAKRASLWLNPWLADRYAFMQSYIPYEKLKTSKVVLYWLPDDKDTKTDGLINNLPENAEKDLNYNSWNIKEMHSVPYGWHAALVEHFSKWEPYFEKALSEVWE